MKNVKEQYSELKILLNKASESYYYSDTPIMSDDEYDNNYNELCKLEAKYPELVSNDSPTQKVGSDIVNSSFTKAKHRFPMLSLKTETDYSDNGAYEFHRRVLEALKLDSVDYYAEPKFDGLGVDLYYVGGVLTQALTRGDGVYGEDVTANIKTIMSIPKILKKIKGEVHPKELTIRGEVLMSHSAFKEINSIREKEGKSKYTNPRNAASGALRQLDTSKTRQAKLIFFAYSLVDINKYKYIKSTHCDQLEQLIEFGFPVSKLNKFIFGDNCDKQLSQYHNDIEILRDKNLIGFDIDGVVYKVNSLDLQKKLGFITREPKWAVAHKYTPQSKITKLLAIDLQVGRTGKVTPVARIEPVLVGGVTVTNVTLHNESEILRKDLRVGDDVFVRRAGDVIPEITGPVINKNRQLNYFKMPSNCPVCNGILVKEVGQVDYRCTNKDNCPAQSQQSFVHFVSRQCMNIMSLGESILSKLIENGLVKDFSDIYCLGLRTIAKDENELFSLLQSTTESKLHQLSIDTISNLDGMGLTSASKIVQSINQSKHVQLNKFLLSLGIRYCGEGTCSRLATYFNSIDDIMAASIDTLLSIPDIGDISAKSIYDYFRDEKHLYVINKLIHHCNVSPFKILSNAKHQFNGQLFCITGSFDSFSRDELKDKLLSVGANTTNTVSSKIDYLICGKEAGSKLAKAQELNIPILYESDLKF